MGPSDFAVLRAVFPAEGDPQAGQHALLAVGQGIGAGPMARFGGGGGQGGGGRVVGEWGPAHHGRAYAVRMTGL